MSVCQFRGFVSGDCNPGEAVTAAVILASVTVQATQSVHNKHHSTAPSSRPPQSLLTF